MHQKIGDQPWGLIQRLMCCIRTLTKTQDYLEVFARFKQKENIEAVDRMLTAKQELEFFERSQLGTKLSTAIITHDSRDR